jgi:hypothetical protein
MALWPTAGRAGRRLKGSVAVLLFMADEVDRLARATGIAHGSSWRTHGTSVSACGRSPSFAESMTCRSSSPTFAESDWMDFPS